MTAYDARHFMQCYPIGSFFLFRTIWIVCVCGSRVAIQPYPLYQYFRYRLKTRNVCAVRDHGSHPYVRSLSLTLVAVAD